MTKKKVKRRKRSRRVEEIYTPPPPTQEEIDKHERLAALEQVRKQVEAENKWYARVKENIAQSQNDFYRKYGLRANAVLMDHRFMIRFLDLARLDNDVYWSTKDTTFRGMRLIQTMREAEEYYVAYII